LQPAQVIAVIIRGICFLIITPIVIAAIAALIVAAAAVACCCWLLAFAIFLPMWLIYLLGTRWTMMDV